MNYFHCRTRYIITACLFSFLLLHGCAGVRPEVDLSSISLDEEVAFAKIVNPFIYQRLGARISDETVNQYLISVGSQLQSTGPAPVIIFVNEPVPAALALAGGEIVLTRGLFYLLESEEELLVLLAHLFGHLQLRHGLQSSVLQQTEAGSVDTLMKPTTYVAAKTSSGLLTESFSKDQEIAADQQAMTILANSGLDPALIVVLLPKLDRRIASLPDFQSGRLKQHHSYSSARIKAAELFFQSNKFSGKWQRDEFLFSGQFDEIKAIFLETQPAYQMYQQARQLEGQGVVDRSITLYLQAAAAAPEESFILTGLGMAYMRQEALVSARQHLSRAARIDNNYYYSQLGLGYVFLTQGDFTKAAKRLRRSQTLLPTPQGSYLYARVFDEVGDSHSALKAYRDVTLNFKGSQMSSLAEKRIVELESSHGLE